MKYLEKTIEYGIYLLVFLIPWQTRFIIKAGELNGYWEYGTYSIYAADILIIAILLCYFCYLFSSGRIKNYELRIKNGWIVIAGLELMVLISIFFAPDKFLALYKYGVFLLGIGLFWLVTSASFDKAKLIYSFLGGTFLQACLGIWQFLSQSSFSNKWLGMAVHNPSDLGTSVVETLSGERWLRAYGSMDHPNILGGLLTVAIILLVSKIIEYSRFILKITRDNYRSFYPNLFKLIFMDLLLVILMTGLFFTFSRGAWAGTIVGIIVMLIVTVWKKDTFSQMNLLKIILYSSILIFVLFNLFSDLVLTRLSQDTRLEVKSSTERIESYQISWQVIKKHWLFGAGVGNYTLTLHNEIDSNQPGYFYQPVHNVYILVWSEIGLFGLLFLILLITYVLISNFKFSRFSGIPHSINNIKEAGQISNECFNFSIFKHSVIQNLFKIQNLKFKINQTQSTKLNLNNLNIAIIFSVLVMFLVDHWWWSLHFGVLLFWFLLGLIFREEKQ